MADEKVTTVQIDMETARKLTVIAKANERSKPEQLRWWVKREYEELKRLKLLPDDVNAALQSNLPTAE